MYLNINPRDKFDISPGLIVTWDVFELINEGYSPAAALD